MSLIKNFINFEKDFDFNYLSTILNRNSLKSLYQNTFNLEKVLNHTVKIVDVQKDFYFHDLYEMFNFKYNTKKVKNNFTLFASFSFGCATEPHTDLEDVYILGLFGKTFYVLEDNEYIVEKGDLLKIEALKNHYAVSLSPRIVLSYGIWNIK